MGRYRHRLYRLLIAALALCGAAGGASAQDTVLQRFTQLTTENGLSHGMVLAMLQDRQGFMWFGTNDGLNRYDGYDFTVYRQSRKGSSMPVSDEIYCLFEDSQARLWVGTRYGLDVFDRARNRFIPMPSPALRNRTVRQIDEDRQGGLWISTDSGLEHLEAPQSKPDPSTWTGPDIAVEHIAALDSADGGWRQVPGSVHTLVTRAGLLFAIGPDAVFSIVPGGRRGPSVAKKVYAFKRSIEPQVCSMLEDTSRSCYVLHVDSSLIFFRNRSFNNPYRVSLSCWYPPVLGPDGMVYLNHGEFLLRWMPGMAAPEAIAADAPAAQLMFRNQIGMYWDRSGNLWLGTRGFGILKRGAFSGFRHLLRGTYIGAAFPGDANDVFLNRNHHVAFQKDGSTRMRDTTMQEYYEGTHPEGDGRHRWHSDGATLFRYDDIRHTTEAFPLPYKEQWGGPYGITEGNTLRVLWMHYRDTLLSFDITTKEFRLHPLPPPLAKRGPDFFRCFAADGDMLWMGTLAGLAGYHRSRHAWLYYSGIPGDTAMLGSKSVNDICHNPRAPRYLWVGTTGAGLYCLDKATGQWRVYNTESGMVDNVVNAIVPDRENRLWLSTNKGITCLDPATDVMLHYDRSNGLLNYEFNHGAGCATTNGFVVFGGLEGIDYFRPEDVHPLPPPGVALTGLKIFNKPVHMHDSTGLLKQDMTYTRSLRLHHRQSMITLAFAGLDYSLDNGILYRYRLAGFDGDWVYAGKSHEATYTNLDAGRYEFFVQASHPGGAWSSGASLLTLQVIPPWWRTWWFYALLVLAATGMLYGLYRYRIRQLLKMERMRQAIARDLHDDIGATLSTISIYSDVARQQINQEGRDPSALLTKISDSSRKVMEAINDMIWSVNATHADFGTMLSRMREHAAELFEDRDCALHIDFPDKSGPEKLPVEKWKDFYLIYKEALNNAAKYAGAHNIRIRLQKQRGWLELSISDDGRGFDAGHPGQRGNGLKNMKARAAAIDGSLSVVSAPGEGTTVVLRVQADDSLF